MDIEHLIEEIESMGRSEKNQLLNRLVVLLLHLLKWHYQPGLQTNSWKYTIIEQRKRISKHLAENPSLKSHLGALFKEAYDYAVLAAIRETGLDERRFPSRCPYTFKQCIDESFYPDQN